MSVCPCLHIGSKNGSTVAVPHSCISVSVRRPPGVRMNHSKPLLLSLSYTSPPTLHPLLSRVCHVLFSASLPSEITRLTCGDEKTAPGGRGGGGGITRLTCGDGKTAPGGRGGGGGESRRNG